jgi:diguanylate cyclase (GGDEF)-like protein/PAS domain S-box-containing protein
MTLRQKTLLSISLAFLALIAVLYVALSHILLNGFLAVEEASARENVQRVRRVLEADIETLDRVASDWGGWNDTYTYVQGENPGYKDVGLNDQTLAQLDINLVAYINRDGRTVYATGFDFATGKKKPVPQGIAKHLTPGSWLLRHPTVSSARTGILSLPQGPMLVASRPILTSKKQGPIQGTIVFGRWLDAAELKRLSELTHFALRVEMLNGSRSPVSANSVVVQPLNEETLGGYTLVNDVYNKPALLLQVAMPREIYQQGQVSLRYLLLSLLAAGVLFTLTTLLLLEKLVLSPLVQLNAGVSGISQTGDLSWRVPLHGQDELAMLGSNINIMLQALEISGTRQRESEQLYREMAQMALNASDVLFVYYPPLDQFHWYGNIDEILGYETSEFPWRFETWIDQIDVRDRQRVLDAYRHSCASGEMFNEEYCIRRKDGSHLYWTTRGKPQYEDGQMVKFIGACTDISERKRNEEALRVSEERLARIVETNADGIVICNEEGRITFANAAAESIFGLPRDIITRRFYDDRRWQITRTDGEPLPAEELPFAQVKRTGQSVLGVEFSVLHPLGHRVTVSVNAAPLRDVQGHVVGMVTSVTDITGRKAMENRLAHQAFHDTLTDLPNRALFLDRLENALARTNRRETCLAVLFIDLDNFKVINDSLGHAFGDELLVAVAGRLHDSLRAGDTAARFGGDEFVIMLDEIENSAAAVQITERIVLDLQRPFMLSGREVFITPSVGIALSQGRAGDSTEAGDSAQTLNADDLLRDADAAMYEAKRKGKARHEMFHVNLGAGAMLRLELGNDLQRAIERNELVLHFQPQVELSSGRMRGVEALVRWQHPKRGLLSPAEFIPLAEESGLIIPVGQWVLREACLQACRWQREHPDAEAVEMGVNLSVKQLHQIGLVDDIALVLRETGLGPELLVWKSPKVSSSKKPTML